MNRAGLLIALAVAVVVGGAFALAPQLDLVIAGWFFSARKDFLLYYPQREVLRDAAQWLIALIAAAPVVAVALKLALPRRRMLMSARAALFMIGTLMLGPGLVTNIVLKDYWGRPRPIDVVPFGGTERFVPWWDPRGGCPSNCSFIAGETSGAFWTLAPAALAPPAWRPLAYGAALAFGAAVGVVRIAAGAHFFSDVAFSGVITFLLIWLAYGLIYRWPATRLSDEAIERALARLTLPLYDRVAALFGGKRPRSDA